MSRTERSADAVRAAARLAKVAGTALVEADLTLPQYRVLVFLDAGERPASHVAALLGVAPSTVTAAVDGLVARGLVASVLQRGDDVVAARLDRLLGFLDADEAETVLVGLAHLNRAMERSLAERFGPPAGDAAP